jgi:hypothetical protein
MKPNQAYALYRIGKLSTPEIVELANSWLEEGLYSFHLGEIITNPDPIFKEISPLFEKAMADLGIETQTQLESAHSLMSFTLNNIVTGEIAPDIGASYLYWEVHHEITDKYPDKEFVGDNLGLEHVFCWLREIWDCRDGSMILYHTDLPRDQAEVKFKEHLIEEAKLLLEKMQTEPEPRPYVENAR